MPLKGFAPVVNEQVTRLVLGSFPSRSSLQQEQYYAHPRNHFWRLVGRSLANPGLHLQPYDERLAFLLSHHIGLWDVYDECEREGSLDSDIKAAKGNSLIWLLKQLPALQCIGFNGQTAAKQGLKVLKQGEQAINYHILPSTSPAYTLSFDKKLLEWQAFFAS